MVEAEHQAGDVEDQSLFVAVRVQGVRCLGFRVQGSGFKKLGFRV